MVISYQPAYAIAYALGIVFSYWFNARMVFSVQMSWGGFFTYPLVYFVQYALSALLLELIVVKLSIEDYLAPLIVTVLVVPLTFILSKIIITWRVRK